jgi:UDP-N-acetylglucosamine 3-dehydrogenase
MLRGAVLGLGMIGRHHARILQTSPRVEFAGAVENGGDRYRSVMDPRLVFPTLDDLLSAKSVDFAIVALPTEDHAAATARLAGAGVNLLIEKPLAGTAADAAEIIAVCEDAGIHAAVGHVERYNPALLELRRRMTAGQIGEIFLIATERIGPFPDRVRDVGVVKDLATHDLDLVRWLSDSTVEALAAQVSHRMGREHEDLVSVTGRLQGGTVFSTLVDWLSPTKVRRARVVGEGGMLLANTLTADLTFFENATVSSEWDSTQALRGVSEGDSIRYALARREPLLVEIEAFCDLVEGDPDATVVTLEDGLRAVELAEAVLESAAQSRTVMVPA